MGSKPKTLESNTEIKYWNQIRKLNIGIKPKNLNLGLVPQPWIKTLDHHCVTFSENQMLYLGIPR